MGKKKKIINALLTLQPKIDTTDYCVCRINKCGGDESFMWEQETLYGKYIRNNTYFNVKLMSISINNINLISCYMHTLSYHSHNYYIPCNY